jgi:DNA-binding PadR family transcriptional regulator
MRYEDSHHDFRADRLRAARFHHDPRFARGFGRGFGGPGFGPSFDPADFARGGRGRRRASRGDIRAAILSLLGEGPSSGYALIKAIGDKTEGLWVPSPGSVYPTLQQLVDEELVIPTGDGRRTEYTLSDSGRAYVEEHAEELDAAWQAAPGRPEGDAELFTAIGKLMGVIHQLRFVADPEQRKAAAGKIDALRKELYQLLAE